MQNPTNRWLESFLQHIFCGVARNSPYHLGNFVQVLVDAVEHTDFMNNTCVRVGGPTGETVFSRLKDADFEVIKQAFYDILACVYPMLKRLLRNRLVALAFDTTDEPYYGKVEGFWIHPQKPVAGSTGCFKYLTVSCTDRQNKLILGSLPVRIGADIVALVMELLMCTKRFLTPEIVLFDRGFDDYRLVEALQYAGLRYQILWRKNKWTKTVFKNMNRGAIREVNRTGIYSRDKSKHKVNLRFVLIKKYKRNKKGRFYNWVFCTNTRQNSQHLYVDKYKKRWGVETVFRVLDTIQIKTTTKNEVIRYFINMFCCLIYNLWKITTLIEAYTTLKNFVANMVAYIRQLFLSAPNG